MFIFVLIAVLALMHFYVWTRLAKNTTTRGRSRRVATALFLIPTAALFVGLIVPRVFDAQEPAWLAWPAFVWLAVVFYLVLALLVLELVRLVLRRATKRRMKSGDASAETAEPGSADVNRRLFLARGGAVAAGVASVALVGTGASIALGPPKLLQVPVRLGRIDPAFNGFRIAVVSDVHLGPMLGRSHTERIVRMINEAEPDLVAIVGDLVDGTVNELGAAVEPLQDLVAREGSFFVTGNHEYFTDDTGEWLNELERLGVAPLRNENTPIRRGGATFALLGVNDVVGERRSEPPDFDQAMAGVADHQAKILLAHQPVLVSEAADRGIDLQLSGHTHGGQMWPFHHIVSAVQPSIAGLSSVGDTQLYVTRGAGFWGPPVRIGAPPDISVLTLHADH
ncbi:metallophosphoesterase [Mycolicibacterium goodii]|uniref:Metallophosphoesterase n=1 Tax=Mycolicibacterium goodii TaxID=134601 RepID=A0ABS6HQG9_MYCGD|nr:metallophosphoesterase [Mycolicibacterium goodii]MBU8824938.1 metallophosphoesterase [Mycolicibacterium goodii]MBU8840726.1 metallophosphoesterase [Mycolicibacterium goodii]